MRAGPRPADRPVVCVIDDDPSMRRSLARLLRVSEWSVHTFASAEAFLARLEKLSSSILVVDIQLSGMTGLELLQRLQELGVSWPAIAMSASDDDSVEVRALQLGARMFLHKPFDPNVLLEALAEMARSSNGNSMRSCGK
ncbi:MAG TPA: response regulator [Rhizomicrobium sp.]